MGRLSSASRGKNTNAIGNPIRNRAAATAAGTSNEGAGGVLNASGSAATLTAAAQSDPDEPKSRIYSPPRDIEVEIKEETTFISLETLDSERGGKTKTSSFSEQPRVSHESDINL